MNIPDKFLTGYNFQETEPRISNLWNKLDYSNPDTCIRDGYTDSDAQSFCIVLPPPNITGKLHVGHSLGSSIQDALIRFQRMNGKRTLWIPGTDHAAIATQSTFEKKHFKETGKSRHDYSREEFFSMIQEFALANQDYIKNQLKAFGTSLDWSREAFTLDEKREKAVRTAFKKMYDSGLIYRKDRVIHWDPKGQTTVSDDEVEHEEVKGKLYTFKYSHDFPIAISTTRPETKVGDTAVAVHPHDERYKDFIGKTFEVKDFAGVPLTIKIIADENVEPDFGTGALGVTPAHSSIDWEMAQRHNLPLKQVINEYAKMTESSGIIAGLKTKDAREKIVEWIREQKLLEKEEDITINLSIAGRTGGIIEPLPKLQWFINVNKEFILEQSSIPSIASGSLTTLKKILLSSVCETGVNIIPSQYEKVYQHWSNNLRDWCISRQILYGHRIPVWYRGEEMYIGIEAPEDEEWTQDTDTLDTWFSSGLWSFSTLGWPEKTEDLTLYHPNSVLETADDIITFWVSRMILMSGFLLGEIPFKTVYLHGLVRDEKGKKMSKSLGNGIDPIDMMAKYGTDALRMALVVAVGPGSPQNLSEQKIKAYKHFANKIWNATRFVLQSLPEDYLYEESVTPVLVEEDKAHLSQLKELVDDITSDMNEYRLYLASEKVYHYYWHTFADSIIEESKKVFNSVDEDKKLSRYYTLMKIQTTLMRLIHPFMPFITEEVWQEIPVKNKRKSLMVEKWPQ